MLSLGPQAQLDLGVESGWGVGFVVVALGSSVLCVILGEPGAARKRPVLLAGVSIEVLTAGSFEPPACEGIYNPLFVCLEEPRPCLSVVVEEPCPWSRLKGQAW